ncbi:MAG: hypothetical protein LBT21_06680 [Oscillospiraceae bacterium]|jgi:ABC-type cobalt transport system substrate-binding protein|nr:hypothetical protein [Oscillospiraceae bacterium]
MPKRSSTKPNVNRSVLRLLALTLCVCFVAVSILSAAFILTQANHTHDHNGADGSCNVCFRMAAAERILKQLFTALSGAALITAALFAVQAVTKSARACAERSTPVMLKVKLNI